MKALERFTKKRFKCLQAFLKSFSNKNEGEELHQIRLEIKKIKALLRLIHFIRKKFKDHKYFTKFRTIFRQTGNIRDTDLRKKLLHQYTQIQAPAFSSNDHALKLFRNHLPKHLKAVSKLEKIVGKEIKKVKSHTYSLYLFKKNQELSDILSEGLSQKDLHGLRKLIKEAIYLTSMSKKKREIDPFLIKSSGLIGNWHDKKNLILWIRSHASKEKATIRTLQTESNRDIQTLRKLVRKYHATSSSFLVK